MMRSMSVDEGDESDGRIAAPTERHPPSFQLARMSAFTKQTKKRNRNVATRIMGETKLAAEFAAFAGVDADRARLRREGALERGDDEDEEEEGGHGSR
jgi:hypothetical protein